MKLIALAALTAFAVTGCKKKDEAAPAPAAAAPSPKEAAPAPAAPVAAAPATPAITGCDLATYKAAIPAEDTVVRFTGCTFKEFKPATKEVHFQSADAAQNSAGWAICGDVTADPGLKEGDLIDIEATVTEDTPGLTKCTITKK
jgi:hypothetical protein